MDKEVITREYLNLCKLVDQNFDEINKKIAQAKLGKWFKRLLWLRHAEFYILAGRMLGAKGNLYDYAVRHGFGKRTIEEFRRFEKFWDKITSSWWNIIDLIRGYACKLQEIAQSQQLK